MKLPEETADWLREAEIEKQLDGIADPNNGYPRQYVVLAKSLQLLFTKLDRIEDMVRGLEPAEDDGHQKGDYE